MTAFPCRPQIASAAKVVFALGAAFWVAGCATTRSAQTEGEMEAALQQPLRDLNVVQDEPVSVVRRAAAAPYAAPRDCTSAQAELLQLNRALGSDPAASPEEAGSAEGLAAALVREVASIPFRGLVRRLTGAEKADREARQAVLAAVGRRGFLRGWLRASGCAWSFPRPGDSRPAAEPSGAGQAAEIAN